MILEFKFEDEDVIRKITHLRKVMSGTDISRKIANVLREESEEAFDNERSPTGEKWKDLDVEGQTRSDSLPFSFRCATINIKSLIQRF